MTEHILVLGATGPAGLAFCEAALQRGHKLTIYARSPSKLPDSITKRELVHVAQGGLEDEEAVKKVVSSGPKVLVSFLGPTFGKKDGTGILFPLLVSSHYERVMICSTPSHTAPQDAVTWKWWFVILMAKWFGGSAYEEASGVGAFVASWPVEGEGALKWTLFRVPMLLDGPAKPVVASFAGSAVDGLRVARASVAQWVLDEITKADWVSRAPLLSH